MCEITKQAAESSESKHVMRKQVEPSVDRDGASSYTIYYNSVCVGFFFSGGGRKKEHTHRRTTAGERRPPGTTSCPPTCQEAALRIGYPGEETWSRRRRKQRQRAALRLEREPGTVFSCQMGWGSATSEPLSLSSSSQQVGEVCTHGRVQKKKKKNAPSPQ